MTDIATTSTGTLALRSDQHQWTDDQRAALAQLGVADASAGDLAVFMHVAQRTGLDPFSRQLYMIKRWDSQANTNRWTIQTGIDGFRIIAARSGVYRGQVGPQWCGDDGTWRDVWIATTPPAAARVGVLRADFDQPIYGIAVYSEYAQTKKNGDPTVMWATKPALMIAKCAEALALRKAFPHDLAGLVTDDETARDDRPARAVAQRAAPVTAAELTGAPAVRDWHAEITALVRARDLEGLGALYRQAKGHDDVRARITAAAERVKAAGPIYDVTYAEVVDEPDPQAGDDGDRTDEYVQAIADDEGDQ